MKEKKKKGKKLDQAGGGMQIRDMSEILPAARVEKRDLGFKALLKKEDVQDLRLGEDIEFVDEEEVEQAKRATANDISGVKWAIKQHRKPPTRQAMKQVKEEEGDASGSDLSVPRAGKKGGGGAKPAAAAGSDSDLDMPRPGGKAPPRRKSGGSGGGGADSDISPPRGGRGKVKKEEPRVKDEPSVKRESGVKEEPASDSDISAPRGPPKAAGKKARHDSDSDISAPRPPPKAAKAAGGKKARHDSDSDLSPPRGAAGGGKQRHDSDAEDVSPPRKPAAKRARHDSDSDLSPPRGGDGEEEGEEKMSSGLRAGLVSGKALKEEAAQVRAKRKEALLEMADEDTGKGAQTVYRSKEGSKITREEWVGQQQKKKNKKLSEYPEQKLEWGGGLKQQANKEAEMAEIERVAAQPFARYEVDEKYIEELKGRSDWNDPMRKFEDQLDGPGGWGAAKAAPAAKAKPKCPHTPWPNRFDILPGYRWDGKVRGNDFEKRWLQTKNTRVLKKQDHWIQNQDADG